MVERPPCPATSASACGRFKLEDLPHVPKNCRIKKTLTKSVYRRIRMLKRWLMSCPPVDFFLLAGGRLGPAMSAIDAVDGSSTGTRVPKMWVLLRLPRFGGATHANGFDNWSHHGVDANGVVVIRRQLKRRYVLAFFEKLPSCLVGIEACASSQHWSRELRALGHNVRLMPPA